MTIVARRGLSRPLSAPRRCFAMMSAGAAQAVDLDLMISDVDGKAGIVQEFVDRYKEVART
jgi:alpha-1,4-digalacturonate transport system substrate-binding protein